MRFILFSFLLVTVSNASSVKKAFLTSHIAPDVISAPPHHCLSVEYPNGKEVDLGKKLKVSLVMESPTVSFQCEADNLYTLVMTDPDVPFPGAPVLGQFAHWVVTNIPCTDGDLDIDSGRTMAAYFSPVTPPVSEPHRYVFLLYQQERKITSNMVDLMSTNARMKFRAQDFADSHGLGVPVAGNYFNGEFDVSMGLM